MISIIVHYSRI